MPTIISIDYNEQPLEYKRVVVTYNHTKSRREFTSGDFVKDWYDAMKFYFIELAEDGTNYGLCNSSSVDHFIMDGAPYESIYLHVIGDDVELSKEFDGGIEFFIQEGSTISTWEKLREMCSDAKGKK